MSESQVSGSSFVGTAHEVPDYPLECVATLPSRNMKRCSACGEDKLCSEFATSYTKCKACEKIRLLAKMKQLISEGIPDEYMEGLTPEMLSIFDAYGTSPISDEENYANGRRPQCIRYYEDLIIYIENSKRDSRNNAKGKHKPCETPNHIIARSYVLGGGCCQYPGCDCRPGPRSRKKLYIDHDHITGDFRGILCPWHNRLLGVLGDNVAGVLDALRYLLNKGEMYKIVVDHESQLLVQPGFESSSLSGRRESSTP